MAQFRVIIYQRQNGDVICEMRSIEEASTDWLIHISIGDDDVLCYFTFNNISFSSPHEESTNTPRSERRESSGGGGEVLSGDDGRLASDHGSLLLGEDRRVGGFFIGWIAKLSFCEFYWDSFQIKMLFSKLDAET